VWFEEFSCAGLRRAAGVREVRLKLRDDELCSFDYLDEPSAPLQLCPTRGYEVCRPLVRPSLRLVRRKFELALNLAQFKIKSIRGRTRGKIQRPCVYLHGKTIPDSQHQHHDEIMTSPLGPSALVDLTYTFSDVEVLYEGVATSDFFVLGKLQQWQRMNSLSSRKF
jgi:hypothetical protein